jgi:hypothetical protein
MATSPAALRHRDPQLQELLQEYLDRVAEMEGRGEAREESFYPLLLGLFKGYAEHRGRGDLRVLQLPRKTGDCLLDFQVWRGGRIAGYVEAKRPAAELGAVAESAQVRRYRAAFPNLLLTNFRELRLYRGELLAARVELGRLGAALEPLLELLDLFCDFKGEGSGSAAELAPRMALRTRILAARIRGLLAADADQTSALAGFHRAFAEYLLAGLRQDEFADLYAQTLAYGLLAARWRAPGAFDRWIAAESIPATSGVLREAFRYISLADRPPEVGWIVDEIVDLLAGVPVRAMLERSTRRGRDPVLEFYETFLQHYDRGLRKRRGVYYTPPELVSYVVRSVHRLLQTRLGRRGGLADLSVSLLDPAAGTLTFVVEAIRCAVGEARAASGDGGVPALVGDHLLRDFHAFELMMAPYAIGHLKMSVILEELGRPLREGERAPFYLANALETEDPAQSSLPGPAGLAEESRLAALVRNSPVTVILGNPPWSGHSANRGERLDRMVREPYTAADGRRDEGYGRVDGKPLEEKNPKWLQDDYVKFLRFAQARIDRAGEGIVAFVTSHSYLDNPTFRGMRQSLLATFDEIYLLDLHGNGKKKERTPEGLADANVFADVRQGAAVAILVKRPGLTRPGSTKPGSTKKVLRADLWGSRSAKLQWLGDHDVETTGWREIAPAGPAFLFTPRDAALEREYDEGVPLPEIFPVHTVGIVTGRDAFAIDTDPAALERRVGLLRSQTVPDELFRGGDWKLADTRTWRLEEARRRARNDGEWWRRLRRILFRPFDWRTVFYADYVVERPRQRVMRHLLAAAASGNNLGLIVPRQSKEEPGALVADTLIAHKTVSAFDINSVFPLYLHTDPEAPRLDGAGRAANLAPAYLARLAGILGEEPAAELVLQYVYAILYSPPYRRRYADLLRADFPRIPLPPERGAFLELAGLGAVLIDLHLLRSDRLAASAVRFEGTGSGRLDGRREHRGEGVEGRLIVNAEGQAFSGVGRDVWEYRIGGYQVLDRWLAGRAGRALRWEEIEELRKIAAALAWTIEAQRRCGLLSGRAFQGSWGQA